MAGSERLHNWLQDKLYEHPDILGLDPRQIQVRAKEYALFHKGHYLTIPDLYFVDSNHHHFIEVKSGHSQLCYNKGMSQLEKTLMWAEQNDLHDANVFMVMPAHKQTPKLWIDILDDLQIYRLGDSFH